MPVPAQWAGPSSDVARVWLTLAAVETERKETPETGVVADGGRRSLSRGGAGGAVRRVAGAADGRTVGGCAEDCRQTHSVF